VTGRATSAVRVPNVFICLFVYGNERTGRFLMNDILAAAGHYGTIVEAEHRGEHMAALEQAGSYGNIKPFAELVANSAIEQAKRAPVRKTQPAKPDA